MKTTFFLLFGLCLMTSCMTEDIHTLLKNQEDHEIRIQAFESLCKTINETTLALHAIINASEARDYITDLQQTTEGYILTFARQGTFVLYHGRRGETGEPGENGQNGADGEDGKNGTNGSDGKAGINAPIIGIREDKGVLYWTKTLNGITDWLLSSEGERMKVQGKQGDQGPEGIPGKDGNSPVPVLGIDAAGYWILNGIRIKDSQGKEVKAKGETGIPGPDGADAPSGIPGPGLFKEVIVGEEEVTFELVQPDGKNFTLPRYTPLTFNITEKEIKDFSYGSTYIVGFTQTGVTEIHFIAPARWHVKADLTTGRLSITAPQADEPNRELAGRLTILVFNGKGQSLQTTITVAIL